MTPLIHDAVEIDVVQALPNVTGLETIFDAAEGIQDLTAERVFFPRYKVPDIHREDDVVLGTRRYVAEACDLNTETPETSRQYRYKNNENGTLPLLIWTPTTTRYQGDVP